MKNTQKIITLKEKPFKHQAKVLTKEEIIANRCSAYEFINFDKQETLEEAINKYPLINQRIGFKEGVKWQQERMYSEENLIGNSENSLDTFLLNSINFSQEDREVIMEAISMWLEQFKNVKQK